MPQLQLQLQPGLVSQLSVDRKLIAHGVRPSVAHRGSMRLHRYVSTRSVHYYGMLPPLSSRPPGARDRAAWSDQPSRLEPSPHDHEFPCHQTYRMHMQGCKTFGTRMRACAAMGRSPPAQQAHQTGNCIKAVMPYWKSYGLGYKRYKIGTWTHTFPIY